MERNRFIIVLACLVNWHRLCYPWEYNVSMFYVICVWKLDSHVLFLWLRFLVTSLFSWMLVNWVDYVFVGPKINAAKTVRLKQKVLNSSLLAFDYFYSFLSETMTLGDHSNGWDLRKMSALWSRFGAWNPLCRAQQPFVNVWPTLFSKELVFDF